MLTFAQFVEATGRVDHPGFLRPGKPPIAGNYDRDDSHHSLALKHKLSSDRWNPAKDAISKGNVRYYHHPSDKEAGYSFIDSPQSREMVADHLRRSHGFRHIYLDMNTKQSLDDTYNGKSNSDHKSTEHRSVEDAVKHLTSGNIHEKAHYADSIKRWGAIHPRTGKIIHGDTHPTAKEHTELMDSLYHEDRSLPSNAYPEWRHVQYKDGNGFLSITNIHPHNHAAAMKAFDNLPHHASKQVEAEHHMHGKREFLSGPAVRVRNQLSKF